MKKIDNSKVLCGILFALIVLILIVAIVRKGNLWGKEESFHANFFQPGPNNVIPNLNQLKNQVINQVQSVLNKCGQPKETHKNCKFADDAYTCDIYYCNDCGICTTKGEGRTLGINQKR